VTRSRRPPPDHDYVEVPDIDGIVVPRHLPSYNVMITICSRAVVRTEKLVSRMGAYNRLKVVSG